MTRYDDVTGVLRDDVTYSTWICKRWFASVMGDTFAQYDGDRHGRERARVAPHLVGAPLERLLRPLVEAIADAVVGALPTGVVDLVGQFTFRLPGLVMASLFGVPVPEQERFLRLASAISWGLVGGEVMRFAPPVPHEGRIVTADVEWHGQVVPEGSIVRLALASATNDETVFGDPRRFDPARVDLWPGDSRGGIRRDGVSSYLGFGLGSHFCAGYKLSRLEAREGLVRLFRHRRPLLTESLPPLRLHQHHLTVPRLCVTLTEGGSR